MLHTFLFYLFATVLLVSGMAVVSARNPVHAVLFLVLSFFNAAGLFLLLGAEFVAFILMIVYVGAVAVLFLFVVMMLDIDFQKARQGLRRYVFVGSAVAAVFVFELASTVYAWTFSPDMMIYTNKAVGDTTTENTRAIGRILYTDYFYAFQVSGLILLVAMIGAIVLTLRDRKDNRRQKLSQQLSRPHSEIIEIVKVESGKGVL
jgi:NADH-quinone oxidoreductase subunit J